MRTLAVFSLSFSAAVLCSRFCRSPAAVLTLSAAFFFLFAVLILLKKYLPLILMVAACGAATGFGWFYLFSSFTLQQARNLTEDTRTIAVLVTDYPKTASYGSSVRGELATEGLPSLGVLLYDSSFSISACEPGQIILCEASLKASDIRYGAQYDGYVSSGVFLIATAKGNVKFGENISQLRFIPVRVKHALLNAADRVFSSSVRPFMKSLMLGDKTELYMDAGKEHALSASGIMHIVAVSGMHIAFVVGFVQLMFGSSQKSSVLCLILIWFFVIMTGCSPSAVRAGIMHSVLLMAPLFHREKDTFTSLSFALLILLIQNPYSVMSVSLQLSFASAAGVTLFSERLRVFLSSVFGKISGFRLMQYLIGILAVSLSVMIFCVPVSALHFHSVQLASPVTNALVIWAVSLCFGGGYAACLIALIFPVAAKLISVPVEILVKYILLCAKTVAGFPYTSLYTCSDFAVYWISGVYVLFLLAVLLPLKNFFKVVVPAFASVISLALLIGVTTVRYNSYPAVFSAIDVAQGECVTAFSGENTVMIDCGGIFSTENAGETAGQYLLSTGRKQVDFLVLTHLHKDHVNGIEMLLEYLPVDEIAISAYVHDDDGQLDLIRKAAEAHGTAITWLKEDAEAYVGRMKIRLITPVLEGDTNERCTAALISVGNCDLLVTGDAPKEAERQLVKNYALPEIDFLAVGHHGSKTSSSEELMQCLDSNAKAVISVGYNTYGHPSEETLQILQKTLPQENIYRTDRDGTVQFIIEDYYG